MTDFERKAVPKFCCASLVIDAVEHGILHPCADSRLAPSGAAFRQLDLPGEATAFDLAVERRSREAGSFEHGIDPEDAVGRWKIHGMLLHLVRLFRSPSK